MEIFTFSLFLVQFKIQGPSDLLCSSQINVKCKFTEGKVQLKMGSIKDRNGMDLTEAEDIKKRWQ